MGEALEKRQSQQEGDRLLNEKTMENTVQEGRLE